MTAHFVPTAATDQVADPFLDPTSAVSAAREHIAAAALRPSHVGPVGLELEFHLVDLARPDVRPGWDAVLAAADSLPAMPAGSRVTLEPGGQIELSTPPTADLASSVAALQADREVLRTGLAAQGYGAAPLGTDPARPVRRVNPSSRYVAMEQHFAALGCAEPGRAMMTSTAALQVNLDAGPAAGWRDRLALVAALGPGTTVDAKVGRQFSTAPDIVRSWVATHPGPVVVMLGTNGTVEPDDVEAVLAAAAGRPVVLVGVSVPRRWEDANNEILSGAAARHADQVRFVDWAHVVATTPGLLGPDRVHPLPRGRTLLAEQVRAALTPVPPAPR